MNEETTITTDIFLWANQTDAIKNTLDVEFFVFNKNYTPYSMKFNPDLLQRIRPLFLYDAINFVNLGAGTGLSVREFELSDGEDNVLLRTRTENVGRAETLLHLIENERSDIEVFSDDEHDFKRLKGIIARFYDRDQPTRQFYIVKAINQGNVLKSATAWELRAGKLQAFEPEVGLKVPADNEVLIIGKDIFIFNQTKFEKLFQYDYKKQALADKRVKEIEEKYKLSFPENMDLQTLVRDRPKIVNKLQKMEIGEVSQEQALDYADTMQLDL
ncbi:MAG TPA: hypothetical protein VFQ70_00060, partial [Candidatus Saccharimonadaceae bacterium]|nr:hypothetical protein [Candidatus Saccharimonadaceae bacterium]